MKLLMTGAASFVGAELARQCKEREVTCAGIDTVAAADTVQADIRDRNLADAIPDGLDAVVHLAAISRDPDCRKDPPLCYDVNVAGTVNVFEAARARGARQVIFASTEWVYDSFEPGTAKREDDPVDWSRLTSDYALSKIAAEAALRVRHADSGLPVTVLRFGIIYGPRRANWSAVEALMSTVARGEPVKIGSRRTARCFIHVSDIARGILSAAGRTGYEVFNIQGDAPVTLGEIVETSASLFGRQADLTETDPDRPNVRNVSNAKAGSLLGWRPQVSLRSGLISVADFLGLQRVRA